jgi:hypothetical protein
MRPGPKLEEEEDLTVGETTYDRDLKKRIPVNMDEEEIDYRIRKQSRHKAAKLKRAMGKNGIY